MSEKEKSYYWYRKIRTEFEICPAKFGIEINLTQCRELAKIIRDNYGYNILSTECIILDETTNGATKVFSPGFKLLLNGVDYESERSTMDRIRNFIIDYLAIKPDDVLEEKKQMPLNINVDFKPQESLRDVLFPGEKPKIKEPEIIKYDVTKGPWNDHFIPPDYLPVNDENKKYDLLLFRAIRPNQPLPLRTKKRIARVNKVTKFVTFRCRYCNTWRPWQAFKANPTALASIGRKCVSCGLSNEK